jgi:hypothetical protein
VNAVSSRDLSASVDSATILDNDHRFAGLAIRAIRAKMDVLSNPNRISQLHAVRAIPPEVPRVVKSDVFPNRREGIRAGYPFGIQPDGNPRQEPQRVFTPNNTAKNPGH